MVSNQNGTLCMRRAATSVLFCHSDLPLAVGAPLPCRPDVPGHALVSGELSGVNHGTACAGQCKCYVVQRAWPEPHVLNSL